MRACVQVLVCVTVQTPQAWLAATIVCLTLSPPIHLSQVEEAAVALDDRLQELQAGLAAAGSSFAAFGDGCGGVAAQLQAVVAAAAAMMSGGGRASL
jgi:hypothetical protein